MKKCYFPEEEGSPVYDIVKEFSEDDLVADSKRLTDELYRIMNANVAIPSADLAIGNLSGCRAEISCAA